MLGVGTYCLSAFGYLSGVPLLNLSDTSAKPVYLSFVISKQPLYTLPHGGRKDVGTRYKRRGLGEASAEDDNYDDDGDECCCLIVTTGEFFQKAFYFYFFILFYFRNNDVVTNTRLAKFSRRLI